MATPVKPSRAISNRPFTTHYDGPSVTLAKQRAYGQGKARPNPAWTRKVWHKGKWVLETDPRLLA